MHAVQQNDFQSCKDFLEVGVKACYSNSDGETALHIAASEGNLLIIKLLLKVVSDINQRTVTGQNPLFYAVWSDNCDAAEILL